MKLLSAFVLLAITAYASGSGHHTFYYGLFQYDADHTSDIPYPEGEDVVGVTCEYHADFEADRLCGIHCEPFGDGGSCQGNVCVCRFD